MDEKRAAEYLKEKGFFGNNAELASFEVGDGNINYVFRVVESGTKKSLIIKYADVLLRSSGRKLSVDRLRIEADFLTLGNKLAPKHTPKVYLYDSVTRCIVMEDLSDYENMRYALLARKTFPTFAEDITTFMSEIHLRTTDNILCPMEKKALVGSYINPEMCLISEKLVFTEPTTDYEGTNILLEENTEFFAKELYGDAELQLEAAKLKESFKSNAQALIHGDLHTGSIFVKQGSTMVLDPEFAFYGPIGYDAGNVIANLIFAWVNAFVTKADSAFLAWAEGAVADTVDLFRDKALKILKADATDRMARVSGFAEWYTHGILHDTAGFAGLELIRRVIGDAKVKDIAGIADIGQRKIAERICVLCAKRFILARDGGYERGKDYVETIHEIAGGLI